MLHVSASRVDVNDAEVPNGGTRPLQLDEPVVLGTGALADIQTGDVGIVLLLGANMRLDSWNRPELRSSIEAGHLRVTVGANTTARFRLSTWTNVVLTTLQPGTEFIVCQTPVAPPDPPVTCLHVIKGEVEWEAKGTSKVLGAGQSTFSQNGDPASAVCAFRAATSTPGTKQRCVTNRSMPSASSCSHAPPCPGDGSTETTAAPETTQGTGHRPRPPGTTADSADGHDADSADGHDADSADGHDADSADGHDADSADGHDADSADGHDADSADGHDAPDPLGRRERALATVARSGAGRATQLPATARTSGGTPCPGGAAPTAPG